MELTKREITALRSLLTHNGRKKSNLCRCEGLRAVRELISRRPELVTLVVMTERAVPLCSDLAIPEDKLRICQESRFAELSATINTQGIIALAEIPVPPLPDEVVKGKYIIALDKLADPGNCGTIARTAYAAGVREIWCTEGTVNPWGDKAIRSGLGVQFSLRWRNFENLTALKNQASKLGFDNFFIADPHDGEICFKTPDLFTHSVIVIGNEANGVTEIPEGSRRTIIPMPGNFESLNAAQAATVLLVESVRRTVK